MAAPSTPIARSKTAALSRVLDLAGKCYTRWASGHVAPSKAMALFAKFHLNYGIGLTPAQRISRRRKGMANAALVVYWPENASKVEWLLLATQGGGMEREALRSTADRQKLIWLGYQLTRYAARGKVACTWRRSKEEMTDWYNLLAMQLNRGQHDEVALSLSRLANQPGFHGVREQSWSLCQFALTRGYRGQLPKLFYVQKVGHGERVLLEAE